MDSQKVWEAIVVGSGPSGSIASMYLAKALGKQNVLLLDKAKFPRDKICGDAQGRKAAAILKELGIYEGYTELPGQKIYGITLSSPNGTMVSVDVTDRSNPAPGYTHRRQVFDNYLHANAEKATTFKLFTVTEPLIENGVVKGVKGKNEQGQEEALHAKIVLACDGANSTLSQKFGFNTNPPDHFIVATRQYWKGVTGCTDRIEIHLVKHLIPGYFWIFPMGNGEVNVGLGMITEDKNKLNINLRDAQLKEIANNPLFKERFKNATALEDVKGWSLPVASYHRKNYANGIIFLGDAASLIDPLSGEGVGNAMISGRIGAKVALEALKANDASEKFLQKYDQELWSILGEEVATAYKLQILGKKFPFLIDNVMGKAAKDEKFRKRFESMLPYTGGRKEISGDSFLQELGASTTQIAEIKQAGF
ncbi:MAG TPA: NAD(P)/FAD-dependent oxidoreductase [Candidatus Norongarragalinales archaeon]|jgi:geranylgeranyl reductase family protein|nr:NAD(P)/FAD-dependent oxidoreductase [Candidatus Norongarragalinales archaeon]